MIPRTLENIADVSGKTALSFFKVNMTLLHSICKQHFPLKRWYPLSEQHGVIF
jgi:hypothetical protein